MTQSATKGAANDCVPETPVDPEPGTPQVVINEVESSGGTPGDWLELKNLDETNAVDVSGWGIRDNDSGHAVVPFASGTTIESGGYLVIEEAFLGFGLGSGDSVTLFRADGTSVVDTTTWAGHAAVAVSPAALGATGADADAGLALALLLVGVGGVLVAARLARRRAATR